jgi:hypothetical protein
LKDSAKRGTDTIGLDIGPSSLALVPRQEQAQLLTFCEELRPNARKKRRLQRKMDRQRRANNPQNYDEKGRVKKGRLTWKNSRHYQSTRRELANTERRLAAHRKSLHGCLVNDLIRVGNTIQNEMVSDANDVMVGKKTPTGSEGQEGVQWIYQQIQSLATLEILPYKS